MIMITILLISTNNYYYYYYYHHIYTSFYKIYIYIGQKNRPPPRSEMSLGKVLIWRINRYVGISREGTVCISWPLTQRREEYNTDFEVSNWYQKFQGVYLMLELHVHG